MRRNYLDGHMPPHWSFNTSQNRDKRFTVSPRLWNCLRLIIWLPPPTKTSFLRTKLLSIKQNDPYINLLLW